MKYCLIIIANLFFLSYVEGILESYHMKEEYPYHVLGIGDACIDLLIPVSEEFLTKVPGEKGGSQPIAIEELNHILTASGTAPHIATGGSSANTIKGLAALNEKCAFLSYAGYDALGEHFSLNLKKWGILGLFTYSHLPTSVVLCMITPDGQRTMRFSAGCSLELSENSLHSDYFKGTRLVHLDGYTLRRGNLTERAIELAKAAHALVSIDLASFEIVEQFKERMLKILSEVDIVFANVREVQELLGLDPFEGCRKLQELCPIAVVLRGEQGCLVGSNGNIIESPAYATQIFDSTGAGDLFASGFLYGILRGYHLHDCAKLGNRLGSAIIEVSGAELPIEKWQAIHGFMKNEGLE